MSSTWSNSWFKAQLEQQIKEWELQLQRTAQILFTSKHTRMSTENTAQFPTELPKELTPGQKVMDVNVNFNPNQRPDVATVKLKFAELYDELDALVGIKLVEKPSSEIVRLAAMAKTNLELGCMTAVKALTR